MNILIEHSPFEFAFSTDHILHIFRVYQVEGIFTTEHNEMMEILIVTNLDDLLRRGYLKLSWLHHIFLLCCDSHVVIRKNLDYFLGGQTECHYLVDLAHTNARLYLLYADFIANRIIFQKHNRILCVVTKLTIKGTKWPDFTSHNLLQ